MADGVTVQVFGLKELEKKMLALGPKIGLTALRSALNAGAQVIKKDAMARVPVSTGRLRKALFVKRLGKINPFKESFILGARNGRKAMQKDNDAYYWRFIEFGHKDRAGKVVSPKPFLVPAFENKKNVALEKIRVVLSSKIQQLAGERA